MVKTGDYKIENFYQGGYSTFNPSYGNVLGDYHLPASALGAPTKPDTANQIQQVNMLLNQGMVPIEVGALDPRIFDTIPKQHFKEINRMAKLAGAKISVHAPLIEPSGMGEQGWSESNRELAERQLKEVIEKTIDLDDKGGMPITVHSAGIPGTEFKIVEEGGQRKKKVDKLIIIDRESGKPMPVEGEILYYPVKRELKEGKIEISSTDFEKGKFQSPEDRLRNINETQWDNSVTQLIFNKERADEILQQNQIQISHLMKGLNEGTITDQDLIKHPEYRQVYSHIQNAQTYLEDTRQHVESLFHKAYKYGDEKQREVLKELSKQYTEDLKNTKDISGQSQAMQNLLLGLKDVTPNLYQPIEQFALEQSSKTFANVAFDSFKKHGEKTPTICIENLYTGMAFSSLEDMDKLIKKSREEFVKKATETGMSKSVAEKNAEKVIGMTLDVGHLNISKKQGFTDEDLRKEVEQIAKHVRHVHLTDNFGYSDSHLPPGMGNVPFKELLAELEKAGTLEKARKIGEFGGWVQHFGTSPYPIALEALGSPIYAMEMAPHWNQSTGLLQGYQSGYGLMLPSVNYQTFGAGFAQLPTELGGQMPGAQGNRMSGHGME